MNANGFIEDMCNRFHLLDDSGRIRADKKSYKYDYEEFAEKNRQILDKVFMAVKDTWEHNWAPNKAALNKLASEIYAEKEYEQKQAEIAMTRTNIVQCRDCETLYSINSAVCPKCLSRNQVRVFSIEPITYIKLQGDCFRCGYYRTSPPPERRLYGPVCVYYGRLEAGVAAGKASGKNPCEKCACKECCRMEWKFKTDPKGYKAEYSDKKNPVYREGTYTPVWIDTEIPVLGK